MPPRLLLVEDEVPVQELLAEYLRGRGFLVATCSDGSSARAALGGGDLDLLITDLKLPDAEGVELVRLASARQPSLCSIVISGYASVESAVAALTAGAVEVLTKPFRLREAHAAVERALVEGERRRWTERRLEVAEWMEAAARARQPDDVAPLLGGLQRLLRLHTPNLSIEVEEVHGEPAGRTESPMDLEPMDLSEGWTRLGRRHRVRCTGTDPAFAPWLLAAHEALLRCGQ